MQAIPGTLPTSIGYVIQHEPHACNNCNIPAHPAIPLHYRRDFHPGPELSSRPILVVVCVHPFYWLLFLKNIDLAPETSLSLF
jgi:hypothetical protein